MNKFRVKCKIFLLITVTTFLFTPITNAQSEDEFTFVFMTDIHLFAERNAEEGFQKAIDAINDISPDFVITGGDMIMDALGVDETKANAEYDMLQNMLQKINAPVYTTMGNHEIFGWYEKSGVQPDHPEYGKAMYENRFTKSWYSFDFNGWHFIVFDTIEKDSARYKGYISEEQIEWLKQDLAALDPATPIIACGHIPLVSVQGQLYNGPLAPNDKGLVVNNADVVVKMMYEYNLKLVLQGHLHYLESIYVGGITFITAGSVAGAWWKGPYMGTEEGFLVVNVKGDDFSWKYFDYGWEVAEK